MAMALVPAVLTLNVSPCSFSVAVDKGRELVLVPCWDSRQPVRVLGGHSQVGVRKTRSEPLLPAYHGLGMPCRRGGPCYGLARNAQFLDTECALD